MGRSLEPLKCENCKKDVLSSEEGGLFVQVEHVETGEIDDIYVTCDSECYDELRETRVGEMEIDKWRDLAELKNPVLFLQFVIELLDNMHKGIKMDNREYEKLKLIILRCAQYIIRDITDEEREAVIRYTMEKIK
jgi:hypothetical protein